MQLNKKSQEDETGVPSYIIYIIITIIVLILLMVIFKYHVLPVVAK